MNKIGESLSAQAQAPIESQVSERTSQVLELPRGLVTVDLCDGDSGKVVQREQGENFIAQDSLEYMKWLQREAFSLFCPNASILSDGLVVRKPLRFPATHIGYWNDSAAEDSVNEHTVNAPLVGWAARWPSGSPTGLRGEVNITESELTRNHAKWVFDWLTSTGNGTFQSVGWCSVESTINLPFARPFDTPVNLSTFNIFSSSNTLCGSYFDGTNWYIIDATAASATTARLSKYNSSGTRQSTELTFPGADWIVGSVIPQGITKIGTDWFVCGTSPTLPIVRKYNSSGTQQWSKTENGDTSSTSYKDITTDGGSNLWAIHSNGTVYRLSTSDGSRSATLSIAGASFTIDTGWGIAYDPSDGNLWVHVSNGSSSHSGVLKIDTSGNVLQKTAFCTVGTDSQSVTSPWGGVYSLANAVRNSQTESAPVMAGNTASYTGSTTGSEVTHMNAFPGVLNYDVSSASFYRLSTVAGTVTASSFYIYPMTGHSLGSRVKLGSPVTKTSSQTLKITYEFDFS